MSFLRPVRLVSLLLAIALLILPTTAMAGRPSQRVYGAVLPITFNGRNVCTATKINAKRDLWLTAAHCIAKEGEDMRIGGVPVLVHDITVALDMAVLFVPGVKAATLKLARHRPEVGSHVRMVGHPNGYGDVQFFQGYVSSLNTVLDGEPFMMFGMLACGGNSGSAVLNSRNEVVSVLQIGHGRPCDVFSGGSRWTDLVRFAGKYFA